MPDMKITFCPPGPEPIKYTASCAEMGRLLRHSIDHNLTIDERRQVWANRHAGTPIEDLLEQLTQATRAKT